MLPPLVHKHLHLSDCTVGILVWSGGLAGWGGWSSWALLGSNLWEALRPLGGLMVGCLDWDFEVCGTLVAEPYL